MKKKYFILVILLVACVSIPLTIFSSKKENMPAPENKELPASAPLTFKNGEYTEYQNDIPASEMILTDEQKEYIAQKDLFYNNLRDEWEVRHPWISRSIYGYMGELKNGDLISFLEKNEYKNIPLENLTVHEYLSLMYSFSPYEYFCTYNRFGSRLLLSSVLHSLTVSNDNCYPIEYIQKIDDNFVFVVYKTNYEGKDVYIYITAVKHLSSDGPVPGYYENWTFLGEQYCVSGTYSSDDFKDIKIGDSRDDVIKIDPSVECDDIWHYRHPIGGNITSATYRLLEDGVLKISFEDNKVSDMEFHPYGEIYSNDGTEIFNILRAEQPIELPRG